MTSKNNRIQRMQEAAERQNHFGIRKLTIGAASVLLGTTLWLGATGNVAHAQVKENNDNDQAASQSSDQKVNTNEVKKVVVEKKAPETQSLKVAQPQNNIDTNKQVNNDQNKQVTDQQNKVKAAVFAQQKAASSNSDNAEGQAVNVDSANWSKNEAQSLKDKLTNQYSNFSFVPNTQYVYSVATDASGRNKFVWTTDRDNPGNTIYFYRNGSQVASIDQNARVSTRYSGTTNGTNSATNIYSGGSYHITRQTISKGGYSYSRWNVVGQDGSKVDNGISGNITGGSLVLTNDNYQPLPGMDGDPKYWKSPSAVAGGKAQQNIYYLDAKTGEVLAKTSYDALTGQNYDATSAQLKSITHDGQTYDLVPDSDASQEALNKVIAVNNGLDIRAKDVLDTPLKGSLGSRMGNIAVTVSSYAPDVVFIFKTRDNKGTADLNVYTAHIDDQYAPDGSLLVTYAYQSGGSNILSNPNLPSGAYAQGGLNGGLNNGAIAYNFAKPGNQDIVFFYDKAKQPVTYTGTLETKEVTRTITYLDGVTKEPIPANLIPDNPVKQVVTLKRTHVVSSTGEDMGYGTISDDGKTFTKAPNDGWNTGSWQGVTSPDLSADGYTAPSIAQVSEETVNQNTQDQKVTVLYGHQTEPTTEKQETKMTVHYVVSGNTVPAPKDNVQNISWTRPATKDKVTGKVTPDPDSKWTTSQTYHNVQSPNVPGYTPDVPVVAAPTPQPGDNPSITVTYTPEPVHDELATLHIIDMNDNDKELAQFSDKGKDDTKINFKGADQKINDYLDQGYKVNSIVEAGNPQKEYGTNYPEAASQWNFDNKPGTDQEYYVYLEHTYEPIDPEHPFGRTDLTRVVTETVHYVNEKTNKPMSTDYTNKITFTGKGLVDKVTGKMLKINSIKDGRVSYNTNVADEIDIKDAKASDFAWPSPGTFSEVISPTYKGYTIDAAKTTPADLADGDNIKKITDIAYDHPNIEATVYYVPNEPEKQEAEAQLVINDVTPGQEMQLGSYTQPGYTGDPIEFTAAQNRVDKLLNSGYEWVDASHNGQTLSAKDYSGIDFGDYQKQEQKWVINLIHKYTPVNPDHPDDKDGFTKAYLDRNITRDVTYVDQNGQEMPGLTPEHQEVNFTGSGYLDQVTNRWVTVENGKITGLAKGLTWTPDTDQTFKAIPAKTAKGFHVTSLKEANVKNYTVSDDGAVSAQTVNRNTQSSKVVVVYAPDNKPEPIKQGTITVKYYDTTDKEYIPGYGVTEKANENTPFTYSPDQSIKDLEKKGYVVDGQVPAMPKKFTDGSQTIVINLKHGTRPVNPDNPGAGYTKTDLEKTITRTINYWNDKHESVAPSNKVDFTFTAHGTVDEVTGKLVTVNSEGNITGPGKLTWNAENHEFPEVVSPTIKGMHVTNVTPADQRQGDNVKAAVVTNASKDIVVDVYYAPDTPQPEETKEVPSTQTVKFVDENGKELHPSVVDHFTFERDSEGKWNETSHKYGIVNAPVIEGYVADKKSAGGLTATPEDPNVENEIIYRPVSRIIPVTPDGKVIPNAPQPKYPNDKTNPTGVEPNEPIPEVPGYTPVDPSPITPKTPTEPTKVVYKKDENPKPEQTKEVPSTQTVKFVDENGKELHQSAVSNFTFERDSEGKWNATSHTYGIVNAPVIEGYVADKNSAGGLTATPEDPNVENEIIYRPVSRIIPVTPDGKVIPNAPQPKYPNDKTNPTGVEPNEPIPEVPGYTPVDPSPITPKNPTEPTKVVYKKDENPQPEETKEVPSTQTVKFVDENGKELHPSVVDHFTFERDSEGKWNETSHKYGIVNAPVIEGYVADKKSAGGLTATPEDPNVENEIIYRPVSRIIPVTPDGKVIPNAPQPKYPNDKNNPTKVEPNEPIPEVPGYTPVDPSPITPKNPTEPTKVVYKKDENPKPEQTKEVPSTQTVKFVDENGKELHPSVVDHFTFERDSEGKWNETSHKYGIVNAPVIEGYVADKNSAGGLTATPEDPNVENEIIYRPVSRIIPVTPDGKVIPNAPQPKYPNDKNNPTKVEPNEPIPEVPGYTPVDPSPITPKNPTEPTKVVYKKDKTPEPVKQGTITVKYYDTTDKEYIPGYGVTEKGDENTPFTYSPDQSIKDLEKKGYVVDGQVPAMPKKFTDGSQTIVINLKHGTRPVNPDNPGVPGQPINPDDPNGPKYPKDSADVTKEITRTVQYKGLPTDKTPKDVVQDAKFTAHGLLDKVTGAWIDPLTWSGSQTLKEVISPTIKGYHVISVSGDADDKNVGAVTLTHNDKSYTITVTYAPDTPQPEETKEVPSTQTVKFVDENGKELHQSAVSDFTFERDSEGKWNETSHTYGIVNAPVIEGYVANKKSAGGLTATPEDPNVTAEIIYSPVSKIIPVTPDGKVIPNAPQPQYKNDKTNPTGVESNEPIPEVPGYTPVDPSPITPANPTEPTKVVYKKDKTPEPQPEETKEVPSTQTVKFVDENGKELHPSVVDHFTFTRNKEGKWNTTSHTYGIVNAPVIEGYVANKKSAGGLTATPEDPNVTAEIIYSPVSKIIPVTPDGKEIPNAPQPQYKNDKTNPTGVEPNEPIPEVPGYTPVDSSPITPANPTEPTKVVYKKDKTPEPTKDQGSITVTVYDKTDKKYLPEYGKSSGEEKVGTKFTYDKSTVIKTLEEKGYKVINPDVVIPDVISKGSHTVQIEVEHRIVPVTPDHPGNGLTKADLDKVVTETVHYEGAGDKTPANKVAHLTFTGKAYYDAVTKKWTNEQGKVLQNQADNITWTAVDGHEFKSVVTPVIEGYTSSVEKGYGDAQGNVKAITGITENSKNITIVVTYTPNSTPVVPDNPTPTPNPQPEPTPSIPDNPSPQPQPQPQPEPTPNVPDNSQNPEPEQPEPEVPAPHGQDEPTPEVPTTNETPNTNTSVPEVAPVKSTTLTPNKEANTNNASNEAAPAPHVNELPQTGSKDDSNAAIAGTALALIGLTGLVGAAKKRRRG